MISAFPRAGRRVEQAYSELDLAADGGTLQARNALGDPRLLARPWDPATCVDPQLRSEIWQWLEKVVTWLNHEHVWDADAMIPPCWPLHPHLVHELAVIADLRRRASIAVTADSLEEWHRYALPAFTDRMRQRLRQHCQEGGHQSWPARGRQTRHLASAQLRDRESTYRADVDADDRPARLHADDPRPPQPRDVRSTPVKPSLRIADGKQIAVDTGAALD